MPLVLIILQHLNRLFPWLVPAPQLRFVPVALVPRTGVRRHVDAVKMVTSWEFPAPYEQRTPLNSMGDWSMGNFQSVGNKRARGGSAASQGGRSARSDSTSVERPPDGSSLA